MHFDQSFVDLINTISPFLKSQTAQRTHRTLSRAVHDVIIFFLHLKYCTFHRWRERWQRKQPAPHNIRPYKGSVHVVLSRDFVDFLLHNKTSLDFLNWVEKDTHIPDELYFTTMNNNWHLQAPGSNPGQI